MLTDRPPARQPLLAEFEASDRAGGLELPPDNRLMVTARAIEAAMESEQPALVRQACAEFLAAAADFYHVRRPEIRVLSARPIRVREGGWASELFGDYDPATARIRVWMRTAVQKRVTSFGTLFATLCHEFCHHLDFERFRFRDSFHTRGFYGRAAALYHHGRGTPQKRLFWTPMPGRRWRIDWARTNRAVSTTSAGG
jgi:hypothetical protein